MFSIDGLISGLDTTSIIDGTLAPQQARIDRLNAQKEEISQQQTAFKTIEAQLFALRGSMGKLLRTTNNAFDAMVASSSDAEAVEVSASSQAAAGTYRLRVNQLAQSHQIKSDVGLERASDLVGTGTITLRVGDRAETDIVVEEGTTLEGLASQINSQSDDVLATVINDGSEPTPYRLLLTSRHAGGDNAIVTSGNLDMGGGDFFDFSPDAVQTAQDAQVQIGNGAGAILVSSESNVFDGLIPGITLDALKADPAKEVVVTVARDTGETVTAVQDFVDAYNSVVGFIGENSTYDAETETAGIFLGDRSAASVLSKLQAAVGSVLQGTESDLKTLSSIGITTNNGGTLGLDQSRLEDIIQGRVDGASVDDIRRLFAIDGQSTNSAVEFVLGTNDTQASPLDPDTGLPLPYEVDINRVAERASIEATAPLLATTVINDANNTLTFEVDREEITIEIPDGSYSRSELADQLQTLFNTSPDRAGRSIEVSISVDDKLLIQSNSYGSDSTVKVLTGTGNAPLGLAGTESDTGADVAGVFRVTLPDGSQETESATGNGRLLTSDRDNKYTAAMQIRSTLTDAGGSVDAELTVTRGIGAILDAAVEDLLNASSGQLGTIQDRFTAELDNMDDNIEQIEERMELQRDTLLQRFLALESNLAELQSAGDSITATLFSSL